MTTVIVRVGSHRARDRLKVLLGELPQSYYSTTRSGEFYYIPKDRLGEALSIPSVTHVQPRGELHKTWSVFGG